MKNSHTPTPAPWEANRRSIRTMEYDITDLPCTSKLHPDDAEQEANAAHIVKCVNCHDDLVAALEICYTLLANESASNSKWAVPFQAAKNALDKAGAA